MEGWKPADGPPQTPEQERDAILKRSEYLLEKLQTDELTGLATRGVFWRELEQSLKAVRDGSIDRTCLIAIDIDRFKDINDAFGHLAGDEILRTIGGLVREVVEAPNLAARMGGEELAVLMPDTDIETAERKAEELRKRISQLVFDYPGINNPDGLNVTASFGIVSTTYSTEPQKLYDKADETMYRAKNNGRNKVNVYIGT